MKPSKQILSFMFLIWILVGLTGCSAIKDRLIEQKILDRLTRVDYEILSDPGIHIIMAGTGSPAYDPIRNPVCVGIIAGGKFMLFDTGDGCTKTLDSMDLPINLIDTVFLTHYHSDHINGLGNLLSHTWVMGRKKQVDIYGPPGAKKVVNGCKAFAQEDIVIRSAKSGLEQLDPVLAVGVPHEFTYPEDGSPVVVWSENNVTVKAFKNDHYDVPISCGYRIEYAGRVIVISGDTIKCDTVIRNAKDADILIHEVANREMVEHAAQVAEKNMGLKGKQLADHIRVAIQHHSSTIDVAEVAQEADADCLLLYHIMPGIPDSCLVTSMFTEGMDDIYDGRIVVTKDKDQFYLEPAK